MGKICSIKADLESIIQKSFEEGKEGREQRPRTKGLAEEGGRGGPNRLTEKERKKTLVSKQKKGPLEPNLSIFLAGSEFDRTQKRERKSRKRGFFGSENQDCWKREPLTNPQTPSMLHIGGGNHWKRGLVGWGFFGGWGSSKVDT